MTSQHVVIVGGSSGIGLATARRLIDLGLKVTITGRDPERLRQAGHSLGDRAGTLVMDATDRDSVCAGFETLGGFDHLVLALGSGKGAGPFASLDLAHVPAGFEEKVFAHFTTAQAALPHLSQRGSITFIAAVSAHMAIPGTTGLGAANAAIAALVPILAAELRPLRVNGVSPGVIDTPWWDFLPAEQRTEAFASYAARTPVERVGQPEDVAQAIAFLLADSFMSGHVIVCDGGLRLTA